MFKKIILFLLLVVVDVETKGWTGERGKAARRRWKC